MSVIENNSSFERISNYPQIATRSKTKILKKVGNKEQLNPSISTSKITSLENLTILTELMKEWEEKARAYCKSQKRSKFLGEFKKSLHVIGDIKEDLEQLVEKKGLDKKFSETSEKLKRLIVSLGKDQKTLGVALLDQIASLKESSYKSLKKSLNEVDGYSIYVACVNNTVQGIAIKTLSENSGKPSISIKHMATHPDNIDESIGDTKQKIKGIGTALITHIVAEIKQSKDADRLHLYSLASSVGFYDKIGLVETSDSDSDTDSEDSDSEVELDPQEIDNQKKMILSPEKIELFLTRHSLKSKIITDEPTLKKDLKPRK